MAAIRFENVSKIYPNGHVASKDLDLEIGDGELLVLVGPSGCGKSTVLRMIAGLETPSEGRILIGERDVTEVPPQERDLAMVFQSYALYPHMTVGENLSFGLRLRKAEREEVDRRVDRVAAAMGLVPMLDRKPAQLSGGQRQRVALGRALVREPVAFLLDEPLSNLDAKLRIEMRAELARLHQRLGVTMVYVTHDQEEAMTLGDRVAVLEAGFLKQVAPPMELYGHPSTRFVAGFIGSPEMNLYDGTLHAEGDAARFDGAGVSVPAPRPSGVEEAARVTLGVRPQEVQLVNGEAEGSVPATVGVVEPIGSQQIVHCRTTEDERLVVVAPIDVEFEEGSDKRFAFPVDSIHLFDAGTGERLE